jgi:hypothetical protein
MRKVVAGILDFIAGFVIIVLVCVGLVIVYPFYIIRRAIYKKDFVKVPVVGGEGEESFSKSSDKVM